MTLAHLVYQRQGVVGGHDVRYPFSAAFWHVPVVAGAREPVVCQYGPRSLARLRGGVEMSSGDIDTRGGGSSSESTGDGSDDPESDGDVNDHDCDFGVDGVDAELGYGTDDVSLDESVAGM